MFQTSDRTAPCLCTHTTIWLRDRRTGKREPYRGGGSCCAETMRDCCCSARQALLAPASDSFGSVLEAGKP